VWERSSWPHDQLVIGVKHMMRPGTAALDSAPYHSSYPLSVILFREKYILAPKLPPFFRMTPRTTNTCTPTPQTTTFWFFGLIHLFIPLILTEIGQKSKNTPPLIVRISKCRRGIFGILFKINSINGRMEPKNQKVVVWGAIRRKGDSLGG